MVLVSLSEAARQLDVPYAVLYYRVLKGKLKTQKIGNVVAVELEEVKQALIDTNYQPRKNREIDK